MPTPAVLHLPVDDFDLETSKFGFDLLDLSCRSRITRDASIGVLDVHSHILEDLPAVRVCVEADKSFRN